MNTFSKTFSPGPLLSNSVPKYPLFPPEELITARNDPEGGGHSDGDKQSIAASTTRQRSPQGWKLYHCLQPLAYSATKKKKPTTK